MKNSIYWIAVGLCVLVIAWKLVTILGYDIEYHRSDQVYEQLAAMTTEKPGDNAVKKDGEASDEKKLMAPSEKLKQINPDYVGWLRLPGTGIDYRWSRERIMNFIWIIYLMGRRTRPAVCFWMRKTVRIFLPIIPSSMATI